MPNFIRLFTCLSLLLSAGACTQGISQQVRSQVNFSGSFHQLQQNPEQYRGEMALLGGRIIENRPLERGSELVVLQLELDGSDRPRDDDQSQGRFLISSDNFLDPAIYTPGTLISVVGRINGAEQRPIGQMIYLYPVIRLEEIKSWPKYEQSYPRFQFGIGIGHTF